MTNNCSADLLGSGESLPVDQPHPLCILPRLLVPHLLLRLGLHARERSQGGAKFSNVLYENSTL
jgi:hypothetical protein